MSKQFYLLLRALLLGLAVLTRPACAAPLPAPAHIANVNGVPTLMVSGKPFLVLGAQCDIWRAVKQDAKTVAFFDGYAAMNATVVSSGIPWARLEPQQDHYDFTFLDWFIQQAETHHLKLILQLFNSNVCGKVEEDSGPQYVPNYILDAPATYQRMVLPAEYHYVKGGPPLCPNDPHLLARECQLLQHLAAHLREHDTRRTVLMLQLDNEFYYQQWQGGEPPQREDIRCHCAYCNAKWDTQKYKTGEEFMFKSFAAYANALSFTVRAQYDIPLYLNSPWWPPYVAQIFLEACPHIDLVGIDGVFDPGEPNMLSRSQVGRNIPFAAENPTENAQTRYNLDVLPYYTIVGQQGIGNLLWECGPPFTVVEDATARQRSGNAFYPLKNAQEPIARARGTEALVGWYKVRSFKSNLNKDANGNFSGAKADVVQQERLFIRAGSATRIEDSDHVEAKLGGLALEVSQSAAGVIIQTSPHTLVLATASAQLRIQGNPQLKAEAGYFVGDKWHGEKRLTLTPDGTGLLLDVEQPAVVRLSF